MPSTKQPSVAPSFKPTLAPTACLLIGGTSVASSAYQNDKTILNVCLTSTVTSIGDSGFASSSLSSISMTTSVVRISANAFASSGLLAIAIPTSVTFLELGVFSSATNLRNVALSTSLTFIPAYSFFGCANLASIVLPTSVVSIEYSAFASSGVINMTLPTEVTFLDEIAGVRSVDLKYDRNILFASCLLRSVGSIGASAFEYSGLLSVIIPTSVLVVYESAFAGTLLVAVEVPSSVTSLGASAFANAAVLKSVFLPSSLTQISGSTFYNCGNLTAIIIPTSMVFIAWHAFYNSGLEKLIVPTSVTFIGGMFGISFFKAATVITSLELYPLSIEYTRSVVSIEAYAFAYTGLQSAHVPSFVTFLDSTAFIGTPAFAPTAKPTKLPSPVPSVLPTGPSIAPTGPSQIPSLSPTGPSQIPTTIQPSAVSSYWPTIEPSACLIIDESAVESFAYASKSVVVVYGSAFAGTLLVAVEVPSSVTSLGASNITLPHLTLLSPPAT
eukprot:gene31831-41309_t